MASTKPARSKGGASARSMSGSARRSGRQGRGSAEMNQEQRRGRMHAPDAISLLRADHREVESLFAQFETTSSSARKGEIAQKICDALTVHATIEEEIFYPQARDTLKRAGEEMLDEAEVEHEGIKWRVELLQKMKPQDDLFDAEVTVLKEYVDHHVKEEERKIFPRLRLAGFDNERVGEELAARKQELTGEPVKEEPSLLERGLRALTGGSPAASPPE